MATCDWTEADVELAERYRDALRDIKELRAELGFTETENGFDESTVELLERQAAALREIKELRDE